MQNRSPREVALGVAIGVFIAIIPLYGLHTAMVFAAAWLVRRANLLAMFVGSSISTTLTLPLITWAGYTIGRILLGSAYPPLGREMFRGLDRAGMLKLYLPLFIGSLLLGAVLAVMFYYLTLFLVSSRQKRRVRALSALAGALILSLTAAGRCYGGAADTLRYAISPAGKAEYREMGIVDTEDGPRRLVIFTTRVMGFRDVEKIYSDPETLLPLKVERSVRMFLRKERLVEDYDQRSHTLTVRKFVGGREFKSYRYSSDGPFHNAVTLPFYLRPDPGPGWSFTARFPKKYIITFSGETEIRVPAGIYKAWLFESSPPGFRIWLSTDGRSIPLKVSGLGRYALSLKGSS